MVDLLAGSAAGATAVLLTYPLDLVRTRLAYQSGTARNQGAGFRDPAPGSPAAGGGAPARLQRHGAAGATGGGGARDGAAAPLREASSGAVGSGGGRPAGGAAFGAPLRGVPSAHDPHCAGSARGGPTARTSNTTGSGGSGGGSRRFMYSTSPQPHPSPQPAASGGAAVRQTIRSMLVGTVRTEGVVGLYRGIGPTMMGILPYAGLKFYVYQSAKKHWRETMGALPCCCPRCRGPPP